jgi:hypothetical protein
MKLSDIQEGKKYKVCWGSACGTFVIGDVVQKYPDGSLRNHMVADLVSLAPKDDVDTCAGVWNLSGEWEHLDCEVEPVE